MAHHIICEAKIVIINELSHDNYLFFFSIFVIRGGCVKMKMAQYLFVFVLFKMLKMSRQGFPPIAG